MTHAILDIMEGERVNGAENGLLGQVESRAASFELLRIEMFEGALFDEMRAKSICC